MTDLTLERIAELRKWAENFASAGLPYCDGITPKQLVSLLDAAERGLTQDRKAAAFDALAEWAPEGMEAKPRNCGIRIEMPYHEVESHGRDLLEAVEAMTTQLNRKDDSDGD